MSKKQHGAQPRLRQPTKSLPPRRPGLTYAQAGNLRDSKKSSQTRSTSPIQSRRRFSTLLLIILIGIFAYEMYLPSSVSATFNRSALSTNAITLVKPLSIYQQAAEHLLRSSVMNHLKATTNSTKISQNLVSQFPELAAAQLQVPILGNRPTIELWPDQAALLLQVNNRKFMVDASGKVFAEIPPAQATQLPLISQQSNKLPKLGQFILAQGDVNFVNQIRSQLTVKHLSIKSFSLPAASRELDVSLNGLPYYIKFNLNDNAGAAQQIGTFLAAQQYLNQQHITLSKYIDVRVEGRAYYF